MDHKQGCNWKRQNRLMLTGLRGGHFIWAQKFIKTNCATQIQAQNVITYRRDT